MISPAPGLRGDRERESNDATLPPSTGLSSSGRGAPHQDPGIPAGDRLAERAKRLWLFFAYAARR
jgi:hypothetical protein